MNRIEKNNAGDWVYTNSGHKVFIPKELPIKNLKLDNDLLIQLQRTKEKINEFSNLSFLKDSSKNFVNIFGKFFLIKEAVYSSKIEGISCSKEEFFEADMLSDFLFNDVYNNYIALKDAFNMTDKLPLSKRFFKIVHKNLLRNPNNLFYTPGEFRTSQNWIGKGNCNIDNAIFVPPPEKEIDRLLSNLENYINNYTDDEPLIKAAIIHSQFETIHPFLDGNGRTGRIINSIFINNNICDSKYFAFSETIYKNIDEYYKNLQLVHDLGDWNSWILFYLKMIEEAVVNSEYLLFNLTDSYELSENRLKKLIEEDSVFDAVRLLKSFASNIVLDPKDLMNENRLKYLLSKFQEYSIITKLGKDTYKYNNAFNLL